MVVNPNGGVCIVLYTEVHGCCAMKLLGMLHIFIARVAVVDIVVPMEQRRCFIPVGALRSSGSSVIIDEDQFGGIWRLGDGLISKWEIVVVCGV